MSADPRRETREVVLRGLAERIVRDGSPMDDLCTDPHCVNPPDHAPGGCHVPDTGCFHCGVEIGEPGSFCSAQCQAGGERP